MQGQYIAVYLRISDDDKDMWGAKEESTSITNQRKVLYSFINQDSELSRYPVKEFCDDGYTGVNFKRPSMQALLKEVRENKVSCIIVKDFSRWGRNYIEVGDYLEQIFPFFGIRFISVADSYDSNNSMGGIEVGFKTLMHDLYSRDLSKKIKSIKRIHQEKGIHSGNGAPFGYKKNPDSRTSYAVDFEAAKVVNEIFCLAVNGNSTGKIARILNQREVLTPGAYSTINGAKHYALKNKKTNLWTSTQVREVIQNEVYIGTYTCHKLVTTSAREIERVPPEEHKKNFNAHKPIVTKEVFEQAQKVIEIRGRREKYKTEDEGYVLKGKVKCGSCGYSLTRNARVKEPYYYCRMGSSCGSGLKIAEKALNQVVLESLQSLIWVTKEKQEQERYGRKKELSYLSSLKEKKKALEMKIERCRNEKFFSYEKYKEGKQTREAFSNDQEMLGKMLKENALKLKKVEGQIETLNVDTADAMKSDTLMQDMDITTLARALVIEFVDKIDIYGSDRVEIKWNCCNEFEETRAYVEKS